VDRKEKILKFIKDNRHLLTSDMKDVHVPDMRHILPKLLMEVYSNHYAPYARKGEWLALTAYNLALSMCQTNVVTSCVLVNVVSAVSVSISLHY